MLRGQSRDAFIFPQIRDKDKAFCYLLIAEPCWVEPEREESAFALTGCW